MGKFADSMRMFAQEYKARIMFVRNESTRRLIEYMSTPIPAGNMPVKTGFLRQSLKAGLGAVNFTTTPSPDTSAKYEFSMAPYTAVIKQAGPSDTITAVYTANYARDQEYGWDGHDGRRFVGLAVQLWQGIVSQVCADAQKAKVAA